MEMQRKWASEQELGGGGGGKVQKTWKKYSPPFVVFLRILRRSNRCPFLPPVAAVDQAMWAHERARIFSHLFAVDTTHGPVDGMAAVMMLPPCKNIQTTRSTIIIHIRCLHPLLRRLFADSAAFTSTVVVPSYFLF